jgi:hypothetical protein
MNVTRHFTGAIAATSLTDVEWLTWLYAAYLGRPFDPSGRDYWRIRLQNGETRKDVKVEVLTSREFMNGAGSDYVAALYLTVLQRPIEAGERAWWNGMEPADIAKGEVNSPEAQKGL